MKFRTLSRWFLLACLPVVITLAALALKPAQQSAEPSLTSFIPAGPLLVLESPHFASLLHDWNTSQEKPAWLTSDNYQVFSRSRLFFRLQQAQHEFAKAAGFPQDMSMLDSVAGGESALAWYNIGKLQFLYITRMPSAHTLQNSFVKSRGDYVPRRAGGIPYFVRTDPKSHRVVAFATTKNYLLLATREDLLARSLILISEERSHKPKTMPAVADEAWFSKAVHAAESGNSPEHSPYDLRLALDMPPLVRSPYFRTYWIQRNISALKKYQTAISDVYKSPDEIREERVLLTSPSSPSSPSITSAALPNTPPTASGSDALNHLLAIAPADAGFYQGWLDPAVSRVIELLEQRILSPKSGPGVPSQLAPTVPIGPGESGTESDLETRINQAPIKNHSGFNTVAIHSLLVGMHPEAVIQVESVRLAQGGPFVGEAAAVAVLGRSDWDGAGARGAVKSMVQNLWTTSDLGLQWIAHGQGVEAYYYLNGLANIAIATHGRLLIVSNSQSMLREVLAGYAGQAASAGNLFEAPEEGNLVYTAVFNHARESSLMARMLRMIDFSIPLPAYYGTVAGARQPKFFSGNLQSLSQTLERVQSASIKVHRTGTVERQTVTYRLSPSNPQ